MLYKMSQYFPRLYDCFGKSVKVELDLSNYATKAVKADLSKLSNVVNNKVVKKSVYDKLAAKVNNIDTSKFVLKTKYDADKSDLEKGISDVSENSLN